MTITEYIDQERSIRKGIHLHLGVWWKRTAVGSCQPVFPLQPIVPGSSRPSRRVAYLKYSHVVPPGVHSSFSRRRLMIRGEALREYGLEGLKRDRKKAITKAQRFGLSVRKIDSLSRHESDLFEIYVDTASRNKHGLRPEWYRQHRNKWWRGLLSEFTLPGRDWFGVFSEEELLAFQYACQVDNTALLLVTKCKSRLLKAHPNDLLLYEVISYYRSVGNCHEVDAGWEVLTPPTISLREQTFGFAPIEFGLFEWNSPPLRGALRMLSALERLLPAVSDSDTHRGMRFQIATVLGARRLKAMKGEGSGCAESLDS